MPLEIFDAPARANGSSSSEAENVEPDEESVADGSEPSSARVLDVAVNQDLISSLSRIMAEQGRLARLATELKPAGPQDDEFGRFAREAVKVIDALDQIVELGREHAKDYGEEMGNWLRSVEALYDRFLRVLENYDLKVARCVGQSIDFNMHDVIEYRRTSEYPHDTVIHEIRKGIVFRGRVLRDAKVVVACNEDGS